MANILSKHCKKKKKGGMIQTCRDPRGGGVIGILGGEGRGPRPIFEIYYGNSINFHEI